MQPRNTLNSIYFLFLTLAICQNGFAADKKLPDPDLDQYLSLAGVIHQLPTDLSARFTDDVTLKRENVRITYFDYFTVSGGIHSGYKIPFHRQEARLALKVDLPYAGSETQRKEEAGKQAQIEALENRLSTCAAEEKAGTEAFCKAAIMPFCAKRYTHKPSAQCQEKDLQETAVSLIRQREMMDELKKRPAVTTCFLSLQSNADEILLGAKGKLVAADVVTPNDPELQYRRDHHLFVRLPGKDGAHDAEVTCNDSLSLRMLQDGFAQQGIKFSWKSRAKEKVPQVENLGLQNLPDAENKNESAL